MSIIDKVESAIQLWNDAKQAKFWLPWPTMCPGLEESDFRAYAKACQNLQRTDLERGFRIHIHRRQIAAFFVFDRQSAQDDGAPPPEVNVRVWGQFITTFEQFITTFELICVVLMTVHFSFESSELCLQFMNLLSKSGIFILKKSIMFSHRRQALTQKISAMNLLSMKMHEQNKLGEYAPHNSMMLSIVSRNVYSSHNSMSVMHRLKKRIQFRRYSIAGHLFCKITREKSVLFHTSDFDPYTPLPLHLTRNDSNQITGTVPRRMSTHSNPNSHSGCAYEFRCRCKREEIKN